MSRLIHLNRSYTAIRRIPLADDVSCVGRAEIDRFARHEAAAVLQVSIEPRAATDGGVSVLVSGPLLDALRIERASPRPLSVKSSPGGELFAFAAAGPDSRTSVEFGEEPRHTGHLTGRLQHGSTHAFSRGDAQAALPGFRQTCRRNTGRRD
jgi:hypothetical protein